MNIFLRNQVFKSVFFILLLISIPAAEAADFDKTLVFEPISVSGISPLDVQEDQLRPGLEVIYFLEFFERHLDFLPKSESSQYTSFPGEPILELNHQFDKNKVFASGSQKGVGMRMTGLLRFSESGMYELQALSNDGVVVVIDDVLAINDPEQHSDRLSNRGLVQVDKPGWYPVSVAYFQRKGTAALKLFWKTPSNPVQAPIPAGAYGHLD